MARPKNADGQRTRQAILDAALDLFADKGYFGTSLRDVATAVGVRESALYNYFNGKEALFDALLARPSNTPRAERLALAAPTARSPTAAPCSSAWRVGSLESFVDPREQKLFRILMSDGIRLAKAGRFNLHERHGPAAASACTTSMRRLIREGWLRKADPNLLWHGVRQPADAVAADARHRRRPADDQATRARSRGSTSNSSCVGAAARAGAPPRARASQTVTRRSPRSANRREHPRSVAVVSSHFSSCSLPRSSRPAAAAPTPTPSARRRRSRRRQRDRRSPPSSSRSRASSASAAR